MFSFIQLSFSLRFGSPSHLLLLLFSPGEYVFLSFPVFSIYLIKFFTISLILPMTFGRIVSVFILFSLCLAIITLMEHLFVFSEENIFHVVFYTFFHFSCRFSLVFVFFKAVFPTLFSCFLSLF